MQQQITKIDWKKLEAVADKVFQEHFIEVIYNDYSPICAMILVDNPEGNMYDMQKVRSLEYYGFKTTHIQFQGAGSVYYICQIEEGHKL